MALPTYDGFLDNLKFEPLPPDTEDWCEICFEKFISPVRLDCGHIFCEECLLRALVDRNNCPKCRKVLFQARVYSEEEGQHDIRHNNVRQNRAGLEDGEIDEDEEEDEDDDEIDETRWAATGDEVVDAVINAGPLPLLEDETFEAYRTREEARRTHMTDQQRRTLSDWLPRTYLRTTFDMMRADERRERALEEITAAAENSSGPILLGEESRNRVVPETGPSLQHADMVIEERNLDDLIGGEVNLQNAREIARRYGLDRPVEGRREGH